MHSHCGRQLADAQHLHQRVALAHQLQRHHFFIGELGLSVFLAQFLSQFGNAVQIQHGIFRAEDVREAALRQAAVQRHLAAFETAHQARTGARSLPLVAAGGGLAHS